MKRLTLAFCSLLSCYCVDAQNLLVNGGFENWINGKPSLWIVKDSTAKYNVREEKEIVSQGHSAFRLVTEAKKDAGFHQVLSVKPGEKYLLSIDYYVVSGDPDAVSLYANFKSATKYFSLTQLRDCGLEGKLKSEKGGPLALNAGIGQWNNYTCTIEAPADALEFDYRFKIKANSDVVIDNRYFGKIAEPQKMQQAENGDQSVDDTVRVVVINHNLLSINADTGTPVRIYNVQGKLIISTFVKENQAKISQNLPSGVYMVRVGDLTEKIVLN